MPKHDLSCTDCNTILQNITIQQSQLNDNGEVSGVKCPDCSCGKFTIYWGHGQAPKVTIGGDDWSKSKTIGEYWDRKGFEFGGKENKAANQKRIEKMRARNKNV